MLVNEDSDKSNDEPKGTYVEQDLLQHLRTHLSVPVARAVGVLLDCPACPLGQAVTRFAFLQNLLVVLFDDKAKLGS